MGLKVAHGVGRQESEGDLRIGSCAIQSGDKTSDVVSRCTICTRTHIECDFYLDDQEEGV